MRFGTGLTLGLALTVSLTLTGCGGASNDYERSDAEAGKTVEAVMPEALEVTPELAGILAAADAADGESDHVVSQCTSCGLAMEGVADHATTVGDYELYFCSDGCLEAFSGDAQARLMALDLEGVETEANRAYAP